jgi:hypothetical protein
MPVGVTTPAAKATDATQRMAAPMMLGFIVASLFGISAAVENPRYDRKGKIAFW